MNSEGEIEIWSLLHYLSFTCDQKLYYLYVYQYHSNNEVNSSDH